jgi:hypothetical protein
MRERLSLRHVGIASASTLLAVVAQAQTSPLRERALRVEIGMHSVDSLRPPTLVFSRQHPDTAANTCRGQYLVGRLLGSATGGALSGLLIFGLMQIVSEGNETVGLQRRLVYGGAILGGGIVAVDAAFKITCRDLPSRS